MPTAKRTRSPASKTRVSVRKGPSEIDEAVRELPLFVAVAVVLAAGMQYVGLNTGNSCLRVAATLISLLGLAASVRGAPSLQLPDYARWIATATVVHALSAAACELPPQYQPLGMRASMILGIVSNVVYSAAFGLFATRMRRLLALPIVIYFVVLMYYTVPPLYVAVNAAQSGDAAPHTHTSVTMLARHAAERTAAAVQSAASRVQVAAAHAGSRGADAAHHVADKVADATLHAANKFNRSVGGTLPHLPHIPHLPHHVGSFLGFRPSFDFDVVLYSLFMAAATFALWRGVGALPDVTRVRVLSPIPLAVGALFVVIMATLIIWLDSFMVLAASGPTLVAARAASLLAHCVIVFSTHHVREPLGVDAATTSDESESDSD